MNHCPKSIAEEPVLATPEINLSREKSSMCSVVAKTDIATPVKIRSTIEETGHPPSAVVLASFESCIVTTRTAAG